MAVQMSSTAVQEFDAKRFHDQLAAVIAHNGVDAMTGTSAAILADFVDHCVQSLARALQDEKLRAAIAATPVESDEPDLESRWMNELLGSMGVPQDVIDPPKSTVGDFQRGADVPKLGPTRVSNAPQTLDVFELKREDQSQDIDAFRAACAVVNAAPSPVMVHLTLNGQTDISGIVMGADFHVGLIRYRVAGIMGDNVLLSRVFVPPADEGN